MSAQRKPFMVFVLGQHDAEPETHVVYAVDKAAACFSFDFFLTDAAKIWALDYGELFALGCRIYDTKLEKSDEEMRERCDNDEWPVTESLKILTGEYRKELDDAPDEDE